MTILSSFQSSFRPHDPAAKDRRVAVADGAVPVDAKTLREHDAAIEHAYERGRRDERARAHTVRRSGAPLMTFILLLGAAAGAAAIYLGVSQGSFARGGQVVDRNLAGATAPAAQAVHNAADGAGDALQNAGARLKGADAPAAPAGNS